MFDWYLFICLVLACIPGVLITVRGTMATLERLAHQNLRPGQGMPPRPVMMLASVVQTLVIVALAAAAGTALAPRVGLYAPFIEALAAGEPLWPALQPQLLPSLIVGVAGALIFVTAYYWFFRRRLDGETVLRMEELRNGIGIWGRVLYGGIVEEMLIRWGLMTLFVWLGVLLAGEPTPVVMWTAIVVTGVLFGLGHAPSYLAAGCQKSPMFIAAMISLNVWASLIFGWLYWQYGLLAAMIGHMLFHLVWWPFDRRIYKPTAAEA
jgi:hypothetical protein